MTKNMTQKGLALGAASALLISGFVALPASSAGLADTSFVSLAPSTGTEYGMYAGDGVTFNLTANESSTVAAGSMKFDVTDPSGVILPGAATTGGFSEAIADDAAATTGVKANAVSLVHANVAVTDGVYLAWANKDINLDGGAGDQVVLAKDTLVEVLVSGARVTFTAQSTATLTENTAVDVANGLVMTFVLGSTGSVDASVTIAQNEAGTVAAGNAVSLIALTDFGLGAGTYIMVPQEAFNMDDGSDSSGNVVVAAAFEPTLVTIAANGTDMSFVTDVTVGTTINDVNDANNVVVQLFSVPTTSVRAVDNSYQVDTAVASATTSEVLQLVGDSYTTRSVTVQAYKDVNTNNILDATEYASPLRTVTWTKTESLVTTTSLTPIIGDANLTATISTTPTLNGQQVLAQNDSFMNAAFTRQGTPDVRYSADSLISGTQTSVWNDVSKTWTVSVGMDADVTTVASSSANGDSDAAWTVLTGAADTDGVVSIAYAGTTLTVGQTAHGLNVGDKVTFANALSAGLDTIQHTITGVTSADVFTITIATLADSTFAVVADVDYDVTTYGTQSLVDRVFAGTYTVQPSLAYTTDAGVLTFVKVGAKVTQGTVAVTSTQATLSTASSADVTGTTATTNGANITNVKTGTTSVAMTVQAKDVLNAVVSAGRPVVISAAALVTGSAAAVGTFKINGLSSPVTLYTDATGTVSFNVTETAGAATAQVRIQAVVEGTVTVGSDLTWNTAVYGLTDYNTTAGQFGAGAVTSARTITSGGTYTMSFGVTDQWFTAGASDTYRLLVTGSGAANAFIPLVGGKAAVVVTDSGITAVGGTYDTVITLQKATAGVFASTTNALTVTNTVVGTPSLTLAAAGQTLYGNAAVLSAAVAAVGLVAIDKREVSTATPAYLNNAVVNGIVLNSATSAAAVGSMVTISGPTNMLFSNGNVASLGSVSFLSDAAGKFEVNVFSTSAQTATVVTVTVNGVSKTVKLTFTGIGVGEGTSLVVTTPAAVKPASTFQVKAKLADAYGNGVNAGATAIKVTYTGPGIVFGTLPTTTDANGELQFAVLLGSNDTGTITVTVSYDQNGDLDYVDTKDLVTTATTVINATGVAAADAKVNVGSFKGYVALYAKGYKGKKMSAIVAGKWIVVASLATDFERVVRYTGAGYDIVTTIYIDGVSVQSFNVTTK